MKFYQSCLGGELRIMTVGESPMAASMPKEFQASVMHASLETGKIRIMASDTLGKSRLERGNDVSLMLLCESEAELRDIFAKLSAGGTVTTPVRKEFWGALYADFADRFGVKWMLNFEK
jgi:PhnB protein